MQFADHLRRKPRLVFRDGPLQPDLNDIAGRKHGFFRRVESNQGSVANTAYPNCIFVIAADASGTLDLATIDAPDRGSSRRRADAGTCLEARSKFAE